MTFEVTAMQDNIVRIEASDAKGVCATLKITGEKAFLYFIRVPEDKRRSGLGKNLLEAVEAEAYECRAKELICEYTEETDGFKEFLGKCGYVSREAGSFLKVKGKEFLLSREVTKKARVPIHDAHSEVLEEMPMFRRDSVADFLTHHNFDMPIRDMDMYDQKISFVSFDKSFEPKSVILSSRRGNDVVVELLFGASGTDPKYILSAGQGFIEALMDFYGQVGNFDIFFYVHKDYVLSMIRKLMDKRHRIEEVSPVMRSVKKLQGPGALFPWKRDAEKWTWEWQEEAKELLGQRSISKKASWGM